MPDWIDISTQIAQATGKPFQSNHQQAVGGGSINSAYRLSDGSQDYFVKLNSSSLVDMFAAEAEGLGEIATSRTVRVPRPICYGASGSNSFIAMEYISMGHGDSASMLGEKLAALHRTSRDQFGWHRDNTIGSTPQVNNWNNNWVDFYGSHRLGYQLGLPGAQHYGGHLVTAGEELIENLGRFFDTYQPTPSLLHGDLWGGNYATAGNGEPVIFDPAVYFGDREADIAMTELFGGFGRRFYDAYNASWPLDQGYGIRKILYNLYHVLNHLNLFGGGYGAQAYAMLGQLQSEYR
jgi:protein-ribulosamine 3-kinase